MSSYLPDPVLKYPTLFSASLAMEEGYIGIFGFAVLAIFLDRFWCSLRFADFSLFIIWFSVFVQNMSGFSVLLSDVLFRFSSFVLFGFRFLLDLSGN